MSTKFKFVTKTSIPTILQTAGHGAIKGLALAHSLLFCRSPVFELVIRYFPVFNVTKNNLSHIFALFTYKELEFLF